MNQKNWILRIVTMCLVGMSAVSTPAAESLSVLLQKGIFAEETEGNLDAAIKIYEGIVKEGDANRSLVAQALYRLAVCRVKKGEKEQGGTAFRALLQRFPDQKELAAKAREQLGELGQSPAVGLVRQLAVPHTGSFDSVSADGQYLSYIDWSTGDVALWETKTGRDRRITNKGSWDNADFAQSSLISPEGKQIVYSWWNHQAGGYELRVAAIESPQPRVVYAETQYWCDPKDWSPDGKQFAAVVQSKHR
jgi:hypothetical protein